MPHRGLEKKIGPLPAWGWMAAVALGIFLYWRKQNASSTGSLDPNAIDPSTGLTYGQEQTGQIPYIGGASGAGSDVGSTGGTGAITPTTTADGSPAATTTDLATWGAAIADAIRNIPAGVAGPAGPTGPAGIIPNVVKPSFAGKATRQRVSHHATGRTNTGKRRQGGKAPAKHAAGASKAPSTRSGHRAPAHHNEQYHAASPSHFRESPASTRVQVHTPVPGIGTAHSAPKPKPKPKPKHRKK